MKTNKKFAVVSIVFSGLYMIAGITSIAAQKVVLMISGVDMDYYDGLIIPWIPIFMMVLGGVITIILAVVAIRQSASTSGNGVVLLVLSIVYVIAMPLLGWGVNVVGNWQVVSRGTRYYANYYAIYSWIRNMGYLLNIANAFLMIQAGMNYTRLNMVNDVYYR